MKLATTLNPAPLGVLLESLPTTETYVSREILDNLALYFQLIGWTTESDHDIYAILNLMAEEKLLWIEADYKNRIVKLKRIFN